jgi:K+-sensing histidine kinase KdpD
MPGAYEWKPKFNRASLRASLIVTAASLILLALLTATLIALQQFVDVGTVTIFYLIAVLFAAIRGGMVPAVICALAAVAAAAFFFYPPIYDLRVYNPIHLVDIVLFLFVAVVTGKLATDVREAKMREQRDALREALIGSVSHELRTPLATIIGSASVLAQSPDITRNASLAPLVRGMREEAERLNDHIQNLLDATRIYTDGIRPGSEWVDPGDIVNAAIARKHSVLGDHQLEVAVDDDLPLVQVDAMLIKRALGQIIENAAKYSPPASTIVISAKRQESRIRIAVQDQGVGLADDERHRIWERFYRSPRHRGDVAGSGLGLWIARALIQATGGTVDVFSAGIGLGTTFSIFLPATIGGEMREDEADE